MNNVSKVFIVFSSICFTGCATPLIKYQAIKSPTDASNMSITYNLQQSLIQITNNDIVANDSADKQKMVKPMDFTVEAIPVESNEVELGIKPAESAKGKTVLNFKKYKDTNLIAKIRSDTQSNAPKLAVITINNLKEAAKYFVGTLVEKIDPEPMAAVMANMSYPLEDIIPWKEEEQCIAMGQSIQFAPSFERNVQQVSSQNGKNCITVQYENLPVDAKPFKDLNLNAETSNFYFSACRNALITIHQAPNRAPKTYHLKIADPRYVQQILIPYKGEIFAESGCGFYSVVENSGAHLNLRQ